MTWTSLIGCFLFGLGAGIAGLGPIACGLMAGGVFLIVEGAKK